MCYTGKLGGGKTLFFQGEIAEFWRANSALFSYIEDDKMFLKNLSWVKHLSIKELNVPEGYFLNSCDLSSQFVVCKSLSFNI